MGDSNPGEASHPNAGRWARSVKAEAASSVTPSVVSHCLNCTRPLVRLTTEAHISRGTDAWLHMETGNEECGVAI